MRNVQMVGAAFDQPPLDGMGNRLHTVPSP